MQNILLLLATLLFMVPAWLTSSLLIKLFPTIPVWALLTINIVVWLGSLFVLLYKIRQYRLSKGGIPPAWTKSWLIIALFGAGIIGGTIATFNTSRTTLHIENGTNRNISYTLSRYGSFTISAYSSKKLTLPQGVYQLDFENTRRQLIMPERADWIFNTHKANHYIRGTARYVNRELQEIESWKNGGVAEQTDVLSEEFFETDTDYVFEAPNRISRRRRRFSSSDFTKTVLIRLSSAEWDSLSNIIGKPPAVSSPK
jgi:hypothetical protein